MSDGNYRNNNQGGQRGNFPEPIKHALNDFKFRLMGARALEGGTRPPTLGFDIRKDGIMFRAYTNVNGDDDKGEIKAYLELPQVMFLVVLLERAERFAAGQSQDCIIANEQWDNASNKRVARHALTLRVGRNDRGVIYLGIESWKNTRPKIYIDLVPSNLLKLAEGGQPVPMDKVSEIMSVAWAKSLSELIPLAYMEHYVPPKKKEVPAGGAPGGQQGGGNRPGGYNGGGGGGYSGGQGNSSGGYGGAPAGNTGGGYGGGSGSYGDGDDLP